MAIGLAVVKQRALLERVLGVLDRHRPRSRGLARELERVQRDSRVAAAQQAARALLPDFTEAEFATFTGRGTITPAEKQDIIAYVIETRNEANPGGFSLGRTGTVTEGLLAWVGGLGFLVLIAMWLTAKRRDHVKGESEQQS